MPRSTSKAKTPKKATSKKAKSKKAKSKKTKVRSSRTVRVVIRELDAFVPDRDGACFQLYELLEGFRAMPGRHAAIPALFGVLERFPDADLGSPGPIVHELEAIPVYESHLIRSVQARPTFLTTWMLNRILNVEREPERRDELLRLLRRIADDEQVATLLREQAREYLAHQAAAHG